jgi:hypothetical protein
MRKRVSARKKKMMGMSAARAESQILPAAS